MPAGDTIRRVLTVHGHRLPVLEGNARADGPPVIFLHGILGSIDFWQPLLTPYVAGHHRWVSLGLPGHFPGRLPANFDASTLTPAAWADLLAAAIRQLSPTEPVALVGYSTGGFAALNLAAHQPQVVASVLSIAGFAAGRWHGLLGHLQSLASRGPLGRKLFISGYRSLVRSPWLFRRSLLANAASRVGLRAPHVARVLADALAHARRQDPRAIAGLFAQIKRLDIRKLLTRIEAPVILAAGDRDPVVRHSHTCELAAAIPHARLVTFSGVGHLFQIECAAAFGDLLDDWLARNSAGTQPTRAAASLALPPQHAA